MMRKMAAVFLSLIVILCFAACNSNENTPEPSHNTDVSSTEAANPPNEENSSEETVSSDTESIEPLGEYIMKLTIRETVFTADLENNSSIPYPSAE